MSAAGRTEAEWVCGEGIGPLLQYVRSCDRRKLLLLTAACCRAAVAVSHQAAWMGGIDVIEAWADGQASQKVLAAARRAAKQAALSYLGECRATDSAAEHRKWYGHLAAFEAASAVSDGTAPNASQYRKALWHARSALVASGRDTQPHRHQLATLRDIFGNPFRPVVFDPCWRTSLAVNLAATMYESRSFDRMPILADALQDAGCEDAAILGHCRDPQQVHVRGCWVVDLVLGKG